MAGKLLHQRSCRSLTIRFALSSCLSHFISFANIVNFTWNVFHIIAADIVCIRENGIVIEKDQQTLPPDFDFIFIFALMKVCKEDIKKDVILPTIKKIRHFVNWRMHWYWFDDKIIDFGVYWVRNGFNKLHRVIIKQVKYELRDELQEFRYCYIPIAKMGRNEIYLKIIQNAFTWNSKRKSTLVSLFGLKMRLLQAILCALIGSKRKWKKKKN